MTVYISRFGSTGMVGPEERTWVQFLRQWIDAVLSTKAEINLLKSYGETLIVEIIWTDGLKQKLMVWEVDE